MARFQKGQSGNPSGRPAAVVDGVNVNELARQRGADAVRTLAEIMANDSAPAAARVKAAESLLDRGFGKAVQKNELSGPDGGAIAITQRSDDELKARLAALNQELTKD